MMHARTHRRISYALAAALAATPLAGIGCEDLPGDPGTQGAVIGGLGGAAAGAAVAEDDRLLGALIGGALGAGGGYLIGANMDKTDADEEDRQAAQQAVEEARQDPATAADVYDADTADLNNDGFVTTDEVIAMADAGLGDQEMLDRLEATDQVFELTPQQQDYLLANGVSRYVVNRLDDINADERQRLLEERDVIGRDADAERI